MKSIKIFAILLVYLIKISKAIQIKNGETIELSFVEKNNYINSVEYDFIVPESEKYDEAIIIGNLNGKISYLIYITVYENGNKTETGTYINDNFYYRLSLKKNSTIKFIFRTLLTSITELTLLDTTKEITTSLNNLPNIVPNSLLTFNFDPKIQIKLNIEEIKSDQFYIFNELISYSVNKIMMGNKTIEYCCDDDCKNNIYNSSKVIKFKKGSKYKIILNYIQSKVLDLETYYYFRTNAIKYQEPKQLDRGVHIHDIDKSNLEHFYLINSESINDFNLYSEYYQIIMSASISKDIINNLPYSLEEIQFSDYNIYYSRRIIKEYELIILNDNKFYDKNIIYLNNKFIRIISEQFTLFNINKGNYTFIYLDNGINNPYYIVESSKKSLKLLNDINSYEKSEYCSQLINPVKIFVYNENDDTEIKIRFYQIKDEYNYIKTINNFILDYYLDKYGNSESLFLRLKSHDSNYYGFTTGLVLDLKSEYYLYFKQIYGNLNAYKYEIKNDNTIITDYLGYIKSYEDDSNFSLINGKLSIITGSTLFSTYLDYGFFGDIYIQKVNDSQTIKLNNNYFTKNIVKLLISDKLYIVDFQLNHIIKLDNDFSDSFVTFYDINDKEIGQLNNNDRILNLNCNKVKIKSNKNALIYFYAKIPSEKKLHEIIFDKEQTGKNMYFDIINKHSDNENIILIKDYGFENHYPMLNSNCWNKIFIQKENKTTIYIENPYDKLKENELDKNEKFILYIANAFDEDGIPYLEAKKFEIHEIKYNTNSFPKNNTFNFQVLKTNKESSAILSQSNKKVIKYLFNSCKNYISIDMNINFSNSSTLRKNLFLSSYADEISINIENNEILNHQFIDYDNKIEKFLFTFKFENNINNDNGNNNYNFISSLKADNKIIHYIKALDSNYLDIKFTYDCHYNVHRLYFIVSLVDENNNLESFNDKCYLTQLLTENNNSKYSLKVIYHKDYYSKYKIIKIDISNLHADINSKFVINMIDYDIPSNGLTFNKALEFFPDPVEVINLHNVTLFDVKSNNYFKFNYTKNIKTKFLLAIKGSYISPIVYIEGPDFSLRREIDLDEYGEITFTMSKPGFVYIKFTYEDERNIDEKGELILYQIEKNVDIIDFNEKVYFYQEPLYILKNHLLYTYNITGLTENRTIYLVTNNLQYNFEICDNDSQECISISLNIFYKFLVNKTYYIKVYYKGDTLYDKYINKPDYIFGLFEKDNIQLYNNFNIETINKPMMFVVQKGKNISSFNYVNINSYKSFYCDNRFEDLYVELPNLNFRSFVTYHFGFTFDDKIAIFVIPNFNLKLKQFENFVGGFSHILKYDHFRNDKIEMKSEENAFIILSEEDIYVEYLKNYYNILKVFSSPKKNIRFVDYNNNNYNNYSSSQMTNVIDGQSKIIYIDKLKENYTINYFYLGPQYCYFYAFDNSILKNKLKILKEKGYNSYFQRYNSDINTFSHFHNYIAFDLEDKVNVYIKKYYGYSNLYEYNFESFDTYSLSFFSKPIKDFGDGKSVLNKLFSLGNYKLFSGFLDFKSLYDFYIEIDNEENVVKMQRDDNLFNSLIKLFKPKINYKLDFEVNHLIKLDPNFDAEVTIIDSEKKIILNKNNPKTTEIKGNNVAISTNSNAILYFYSSISSIISSGILNNMYQYKIEPQKQKNLELIIETKIYGDIHYTIDVGFEGYAPLDYKSFPKKSERCYSKCELFFQNYQDMLKTELVEGENLFVYYYLETDKPEKIQITETPTYYSSLNHFNNNHNFFVIRPNIDGEEEKNLIFNSLENANNFRLQVDYCLNNNEAKPKLKFKEYPNGFEKDISFENSDVQIIYMPINEIYKLNFESKNEFIFSYYIDYYIDNIISSSVGWNYERKVNSEIIIKKAEINYNTKNVYIQFTPNYINSSTLYFIIISPKNETYNLESFKDFCVLVKLITENSNGVKIYEATSIGDEEYIDVNIFLGDDLLSKNDNNQEFIVNIVSKEIKFDKRIKKYEPKLIEATKKIKLNQEINFNGEDLLYELNYERINNVNEICIFFYKSNSVPFKLNIRKPDSTINSFTLEDKLSNLIFECNSDGLYSLNIISLTEKNTVQGNFKIVSSGRYFDLDIFEYKNISFNTKLNYQPSPLMFNVYTYKQTKDYLLFFNYTNSEILIQDKYKEKIILNNGFIIFEKGQNYQINVTFSQISDDQNIQYKLSITKYQEYIIEDLTLGNKIYNIITFLKVKFETIKRYIIRTEQNPQFFISNILESNYNNFPNKFNEYYIEQISDSIIVKNNSYDYAILIIVPEKIGENVLIEFTNGNIYKDAQLDERYYVENIYTFFKINFESIKDIEALILYFEDKYIGKVTINSDVYNNTKPINIQYQGTTYFEIPTKKTYILYLTYYSRRLRFKFVSTGNLFTMNLNYFDKVIFNEMILQNEPSPITYKVEYTGYKKMVEFLLQDKDYSDIIYISKNNEDNFIPLKNIEYYCFERDNTYHIRFNYKKLDNGNFRFEAYEFDSSPDINMKSFSNSFHFNDLKTHFIEINYNSFYNIKELYIVTSIGQPIFYIANVENSEFYNFPYNIGNLDFREISNIISIDENFYYGILMVRDFYSPFSFNIYESSSFINLEEIKNINMEEVFILNYEKPSEKSNEIILVYYNLIQYYTYYDASISINGPNNYVMKKDIGNELISKSIFAIKDNGNYSIIFTEDQGYTLKGTFKILSTGYPFKMDIDNDLINFDSIQTEQETSGLLFSFDLSDKYKDYIKKFIINYNEISGIISVKKNEGVYNYICNNYYTFEKNNNYTIQINFIKNLEKNSYIIYETDIKTIIGDNIQNLRFGKITFKDKVDKLIKINYTEINSFEIINNIGKPTYAFANIDKTQYNDFPRNIHTIKFNKLNNSIIKRHANIYYGILIIYLNDDRTEIELNPISGPSAIEFDCHSHYTIDKNHTSFLFNYKKPSNNDEIIIINYSFNESKRINVFIERPNLDDEIFKINKKTGNIYFKVKDEGEIMINFEEILSNDEEGSLSGEFRILSTGKTFEVDIKQDLIEFNEIKTSTLPSPLLFTFDLLDKDYIKKLVVNNGELSKIIQIKKNNDNYTSINNNYFTFEENNNYTIQINFQKSDENYILNDILFIEFSKDNIEYLNESKNKSYNELDKDKFILFNFKFYSKLSIIQNKGSSIFSKAIINEEQYNIFPKNLQNIQFESLNETNIEIKKENNSTYGVLMLHLKEKITEIYFKFEKEENKNNSKGTELSSFAISMIIISSIIGLLIIGVIIFILIRNYKFKRHSMNDKALNNELMEMNEKIEP